MASTKPVFLREVYHRLTGDHSCSTNKTEKAVDEGVKQMTSTKPVFLREVYHRLTGDHSCSTNETEKAVDEGVKQMIEHEDPDLILDRRAENDEKPEKFKSFLEY